MDLILALSTLGLIIIMIEILFIIIVIIIIWTLGGWRTRVSQLGILSILAFIIIIVKSLFWLLLWLWLFEH
jgi:hypothetical protein